MGISKATSNIIIDNRREKQNGTYPLKLRVIFQRRSKDYKIGVDLTQSEFEQLNNPRNRIDRLKDIKIRIGMYEAKANEIISKLPDFSYKMFEYHFFGKSSASTSTDIYTMMETYILKLSGEGRVSTAQSYKTALASLKSFKTKLRYDDIDSNFLRSYEQFVKSGGLKDASVGIYLRSFRTIVNQAIEAGFMKREDYPFKRGSYIIPSGQNTKKAIRLEQIQAIYNYPTMEGSSENQALNLWIFSYVSNGLNIKDICRLKYSNLEKEHIRVVRAKTALTSRGNQKEIKIPLHPRALSIINQLGNKDKSPNNYVFPYLTNGVSPLKERMIVQNITKIVNKYMKRIGEILSIEIPLTSYVARHSFSTILMQSNAPISLISKSLGHSSIKTTENYLGSYEDSELIKYSKALTNFNKSDTIPSQHEI